MVVVGMGVVFCGFGCNEELIGLFLKLYWNMFWNCNCILVFLIIISVIGLVCWKLIVKKVR